MTITFQAEPREILETVVQDAGFKALTQIPVFAAVEFGLVAASFGLFGLCSYFYLQGQLPLLAMWGLNGCAVYMAFTPLHDATHRSLSGNRWLNDSIGTVSCLLLLPGITTRIYRYLHLEHHRYAGDPQRDPDEPFVSSQSWRAVAVTAGLDVLWTRWYINHWSERPKGERIEFSFCIAVYVAIHIYFLSSPYALQFFLVWMIPQRIGLFLVAWFFARIQHPKDIQWEKHPFQTTVRIVCSRLADVMMLGQARHCLHHLAPSIPFYRYHKAWEMGRARFETQHVPTRTLFSPSDDIRLPVVEPAESSAAAPVSDVQDTAFEVEIASSGEVLTVEPDEFLIDVLHSAGYQVACSCTQGMCGSCLTPVLSGEPDHRDFILDEADHAANDLMTVCVSRAKSKRLVLDL